MTAENYAGTDVDAAGPLVTIGIPTYNRAQLLRESILSAKVQTYQNIEIIVSDNSSTDSTPDVVREEMGRDTRIKYVRSAVHTAAVHNFVNVLAQASGEYFMWLGDDDWIDPDYVLIAVRRLQADPAVVLVGGKPTYYRKSVFSHEERIFSFRSDDVWRRLISYHWRVRDNGVFYGLMRTSMVREIRPANTLAKFGGDHLLVAALAARGKVIVEPNTAIHRELGGASSSYQAVARAANKSIFFGFFPFSTLAVNAFLETANYPLLGKSRAILVAFAVFATIVLRSVHVYGSALVRKVQRGAKFLRNAVNGG